MVTLLVVAAVVGIVGLFTAYGLNIGGFRDWVISYQRQYSQGGGGVFFPPPRP